MSWQDTSRPVRVVMLDLLAIVPYYCAHLCSSLSGHGSVSVLLASVAYRHDPECFRGSGVQRSPIGVDWVSRVPRLPDMVRQGLRAAEYLFNLTALAVRSLFARPDIIHIQFLPLLSSGIPVELGYVRLLRMLGCRIVYTVHNVLPQDGGNHRRGLYRRMYSMADILICHDKQAADRLVDEFDVAREHLWIIPHGPLFNSVPRLATADARRRMGLSSEEQIVLWQGIIRPYKGISFLLQVWRQVAEKNPLARLVIAGTGDPELLGQLRDEVAALGIAGRVRLDFRFLSVGEVVGYSDAADIIVYPYREITTSGALLTCTSAGKPIVASALPAFQNILRNEQNALLPAYGDVDAWTNCLTRLLLDGTLRDSMSRALRSSESTLPTWDGIARSTIDCYRASLVTSQSMTIRTTSQ